MEPTYSQNQSTPPPPTVPKKAVKFYAWEESYSGLLAAARRVQVDAATYFKSLQIMGVVLGRASPIVGTASVFVVRTAEVSE